jgi:hypothetical protein
MPSTGSSARGACPRSLSFYLKRSTRRIYPGSPRHSSARSRTATGPLLRRTVEELDINRLIRELHDPRQLQANIQSAIVQAALSQILARLSP